MIKTLFFTAALLMPGLAYAGNPSTTLSGQIVSAASEACDYGPNYAGSVPAPAQAAGFTHCAANYDFTTRTFTTLSNWLSCIVSGGGGGGGSAALTLYAVTWTGSGAGGVCGTNWLMDTDGGSQVLHLHTAISDNSSFGGVGVMPTTGRGATCPTGTYPCVDFPQGKWIEMTFRLSTAMWNMAFNTTNVLSFDFWGGGGNVEEDFLELAINPHGNDEQFLYWSGGVIVAGAAVAGNGQAQYTLDPTSYHTIAMLVTTDGSDLAICGYLDGTPAPHNCVKVSSSHTVSASDISGRGNFLDYCGPSALNSAPTSASDCYIKSIRVFSCPSWKSTACTGSLYTGP